MFRRYSLILPIFSILTLLAITIINLPISSAHRILFYAPGYGPSHIIFHVRFADAIARGGHEVLMLEPELKADPAAFKGPTLAKRLILNGIWEKPEERKAKWDEEMAGKMIFTREPVGLATSYGLLTEFMERMPQMCEKLLLRKDVLDELRGWHFDAFVYQPFGLCGAGLGHLLGIKTQIMATSLTLYELANDLMGLPWLSSHVPAALVPDFGDQLGYWDRIRNLIAVEAAKRAFSDPETTQIFRRHFGSDFPDLVDLARETSMCFVNSNEFTDFPRPLQSNVIQIGGLDLLEDSSDRQRNDTLGHLEAEMAKGREGVVLIAFGTNVPTRLMPKEFRQNFLRAIREVPECHFIMKVDKEDVDSMKTFSSGIPNLYVTSWVPQTKILAHPRLRLFVSHGGFNSMAESAFHGVPTVAIPFIVDQFRTTRLAVRNGWAIRVDKGTLFDGPQKLTEAIRELLSNPEFKRRAQRMRRLLRALPLSAEQRLHRNLRLLLVEGEGDLPEWKSAGRHMGWTTFYNLDILVPALLGIELLLYLFTRAMIAFFRWMINSRRGGPARIRE